MESFVRFFYNNRRKEFYVYLSGYIYSEKTSKTQTGVLLFDRLNNLVTVEEKSLLQKMLK